MPLSIVGKDAFATCDCGKDITITNEYGMFCEDICGYEESVEASKQVDDLISKLLNEKNQPEIKLPDGKP